MSLANLLPLLDSLDAEEREPFVVTKINSIVTRRGKYARTFLNIYAHFCVCANLDSGTDEISTDEKVRKASRSFRQTFDVSSSERLVNCTFFQSILYIRIFLTVYSYIDYSSAYHTNRFTSQGWLYISENYLAFYSFLLGYETKLLIELKDVQDIKKEKSKRGVFSDALKISMKDKSEVT